MADEFGSMAGRAAGKVALKSLFNPSTDIVKAIPQGIIELGLRGLAVVSLYRAIEVRSTPDLARLLTALFIQLYCS